VISDLEFVQFHPTVLWLGEGATGQQPLLSEAMRGEGAVLVDRNGVRFMQGVHRLADLAPRDIVAKAIVARMQQTDADHVYLDARHLGKAFLETRFPSIVARCRELGFDPVSELLPVAPAQHYASGGVRTDLTGRSNLPGLYACGEVSCTGVHGANRLASNSLLEGLVFAHRIADDITSRLANGDLTSVDPSVRVVDTTLVAGTERTTVQRAMTRGAGAVRSADSLAQAAKHLEVVADSAWGSTASPGARREPAPGVGPDTVPVVAPGTGPVVAPGTGPDVGPVAGPDSWETSNMLHVAQLLTAVAALREETRGGHMRSDFPERNDSDWLGNTHAVREQDGSITTTFHPIINPVDPAQDPS
jgi:L-aspartate oxidase